MTYDFDGNRSVIEIAIELRTLTAYACLPRLLGHPLAQTLRNTLSRALFRTLVVDVYSVIQE